MATGLNFQTQTIINSNLDPDSGKVLFNTGKNQISDSDDNILYVKRDFQFHKDDSKGKVLTIRKKAGYDAKMCKATIDFGDLTTLIPSSGKNYCRLDIYLSIEGAQPYIYSNPWIQKGTPFWIEFTVSSSDTGQNIAENLAKEIKKNQIFLLDKDVIKVSTSSDQLILEGATEYQRFKSISISSFEVDDEYAQEVAKLGDTGITLNERGENAFGTYSQIIRDLRLPTAANTQWTHLRQVETPIVGAIYDQYIIEYCAPSTNDGMQAVGQRMDSYTTHVFWVKHDTTLISAWEAALAKVGTVEDVAASKEEEEEEDDD